MADTLSILKYYLCYKYKKRFSDRSALEWWRVQKIRKHLEYVREHSRLYKETKKLFSCPVIGKKFMVECSDELNTVGIGREEALEFAVLAECQRNFSPKFKGITIGLSSDTSGKQGVLLVSDDGENRRAGYILAGFLPRSLSETHSIAFSMRAGSNLYQTVKSKNIQFHFFDIYKDMEEHRKWLEEIRPRILTEQPLLLLMIVGDVRKRKTDICPRAVIPIAEVLEQTDERRIRGAFGLSATYQVYRCTEGCLIAACSMGTLHLNEDIVYVERKYLDGRRFVPVVTDLEREAQPVIRYRLNDILVKQKEPCGRGSPFLTLERIGRHKDDVSSFKGKDGRNMPVFPDFIRRCILFRDKGSGEDQVGPSGDYRIVQETDGRLTVYTDTVDPGKQRVLKEFELLLKDCGFLLPDIPFQPYNYEKGRKMECVERRGAEPVKGRYI